MDKNEAGSAADRLADLRDKVGPTAAKGMDAASTYGPMAKEKATAAATAAAEAARAYGPVVANKAQQAAEVARPQVEKARMWARPRVEQGVEKVTDALESVAPRVDAARDALVEEIVPKLSTAVASLSEAASNAREQAAELAAQAADLAARAGEQARQYADRPDEANLQEEADVSDSDKKRDRKGGGFLFFGLLAAAGAAAAAVLGRKPKEDPWAVPTTESGAVTVPSTGAATATAPPTAVTPSVSTTTAPPIEVTPSAATVTADGPPADIAAAGDAREPGWAQPTGVATSGTADVTVPERDPATDGPADEGHITQHSPYEMGVVDDTEDTTTFETATEDEVSDVDAAAGATGEPVAGDRSAEDDTRRDRGSTAR